MNRVVERVGDGVFQEPECGKSDGTGEGGPHVGGCGDSKR